MQLPGLWQNLSSAVILGAWFGSFILPPRVSFILIAYPLPMPGMAVTRGKSLSCDVYPRPYRQAALWGFLLPHSRSSGSRVQSVPVQLMGAFPSGPCVSLPATTPHVKRRATAPHTHKRTSVLYPRYQLRYAMQYDPCFMVEKTALEQLSDLPELGQAGRSP